MAMKGLVVQGTWKSIESSVKIIQWSMTSGVKFLKIGLVVT